MPTRRGDFEDEIRSHFVLSSDTILPTGSFALKVATCSLTSTHMPTQHHSPSLPRFRLAGRPIHILQPGLHKGFEPDCRIQSWGYATTTESAAFEGYAADMGDQTVAETEGTASLGLETVGCYCSSGMECVVVVVAVSEGDYRVRWGRVEEDGGW